MTSEPKDSIYKEGYQVTLENAKRLFKIAGISANENEFGIACSLSILAAEESMKAIFLILRHFDNDAEIDDFDKIFKDHKIKHINYPDAYEIFQAVVEIFYTDEGLYNYFIDMINRLVPEHERTNFLEESKIGLDFLKRVNFKLGPKSEIDKKIDIEKEKEWWSKANLEKNRGLYVDKAENGWHDPKSFSKEKYEDFRQHTYYIIENAEKVVQLINKGIESKRNKNFR